MVLLILAMCPHIWVEHVIFESTIYYSSCWSHFITRSEIGSNVQAWECSIVLYKSHHSGLIYTLTLQIKKIVTLIAIPFQQCYIVTHRFSSYFGHFVDKSASCMQKQLGDSKAASHILYGTHTYCHH